MANILFRSPYFVTITTGGHLSAQLALTIDGTLRYTILKNAVSNRTVFEIGTLVRDYFVANFAGADYNFTNGEVFIIWILMAILINNCLKR